MHAYTHFPKKHKHQGYFLDKASGVKTGRLCPTRAGPSENIMIHKKKQRRYNIRLPGQRERERPNEGYFGCETNVLAAKSSQSIDGLMPCKNMCEHHNSFPNTRPSDIDVFHQHILSQGHTTIVILFGKSVQCWRKDSLAPKCYAKWVQCFLPRQLDI